MVVAGANVRVDLVVIRWADDERLLGVDAECSENSRTNGRTASMEFRTPPFARIYSTQRTI